MKGIEELDSMIEIYKGRTPYDYSFLLSEAVLHYRGKNFKRVLDVGAGLGFLGILCKYFNFEYFGLEGNQESVNFLLRNGLNVKHFIVGKGNKLPFDDNFFSAVICNQFLEHIDKEDGKFLIGELIRVAEPGGVIIIKSPSYYFRFQRTAPHHVYCWKPKELKNFVQQSFKGLDIVQTYIYSEFWHFFAYNKQIERDWHLQVKYPRLKKLLYIPFYIFGKTLKKLFDLDFFIANADLTIIKHTSDETK